MLSPRSPRSNERDLCGAKIKADAVDAVAQTRGLWSIIEDVTLMASAAGAMNLGASHAQTAVFPFHDIGSDGRLRKTGPAGAGVELVRGGKELGGATRTMELTSAVLGIQRAGEGPFGSFLSEHAIGGGAETFSPLRVAEAYWIGVRRFCRALGAGAIAGT